MRILSLIFLLAQSTCMLAQQVVLKGIVKDTEDDLLPFASVMIYPDSMGTPTDASGRFRLSTTPGRKSLVITYTGFETLHRDIIAGNDSVYLFILAPRVSQLRAVTVTGDRHSSEDLVNSTRTGTTTLTQKDINAIPTLGGEADLIKTLQLLPGTVRGIEGSSDLFVRGGAADQNLVLLDGAPIYNTTHLFGFLSVFNPSILDHVEAINGGFPAEFGGRLSSILDITSNSHVAETTKVSGDIGLIATRLYVEQPLSDRASFWLAGRRTYIDKVVSIIGEELPYFFYDLNGKFILQPGKRNKVEMSFYRGQDLLDIFRDRNNDGNGFTTSYVSANSTQSVRWAHTFPSSWMSSLSLTRSAYNYDISNRFEDNELLAFSDVEDYSAKLVFRKDSLSGNASLQFGGELIRHGISPNIVNTTGVLAEVLESSESQGKVAHEVATHAQYEFSPAKDIEINAGVRVSAGLVSDRRYVVGEPRLAVRYALGADQAVKLSYSRMSQYMHRISNSAVSTPTDVWYTITKDIAPQTSHQVSAAWQRFLPSERIFFGVETYYKTMRDILGYEEGTNLFFNADFESKLIQGVGRAYGVEFLARKEAGRMTGWVSYTLSWSERRFDAINNGMWFPARYDRRHNGALVMQYAIGKRLAASVVWEFISGARFTPVVGQYTVLAPTLTGVDLIPIFSGINEVKLADTHRLDLGIKFMSKPDRKFRWHWFAGVYNAYNRASPVGMVIEESEEDGRLRYLQPGIFGIIPFISYGFSF